MNSVTNFKLIAIIPFKGCDLAFSKVLETGKVYQLHTGYEIILDPTGEKVESILIDEKKAAPANLYQLSNGIGLSFSAVVGKNGTGKSSLFELLYRAVYFLGIRSNFGNKRLLASAVEKLAGHFAWLEGELYHLIGQTGIQYEDYPLPQDPPEAIDKVANLELYLLELVRRHKLSFNIERAEKFDDLPRIIAAELKSMIADTKAYIEDEKAHEEKMSKGFNVSIVYEAGGEIIELHCGNGKVSQSRFLADGKRDTETVPNFDLEKFFYTISLNYSHHGLNANSLGRWVNKLFHKNDAYITPLVLNPMRTDGNVDINRELKLSKERLISTLLYEIVHNNKKPLLGKYAISKFIFSIKKRDTQSGALKSAVNPDTGEVYYWGLIEEKYRVNKKVSQLPNGQAALEYLSRKITKISSSYDFLISNSKVNVGGLSAFLDEDKSHVTRKIRQTVNYLLGDVKALNNYWKTEEDSDPAFLELSPDELVSYMHSFGIELTSIAPSKLIEYAFPGFFDVDFEFLYGEETVKLSGMSSGEQQLIFNSNAVLYHLYNIQSVYLDKKNGNPPAQQDKKRPEYPYVNIILDEMELYYHPEMQRRLVSDMIRDLEKLSPEMGIKGIHVCILTHSPFVLSDIPIRSTLHLRAPSDKEHTYGHQSFAANIHDILRKDFFLSDGFMGEYAKKQIDILIDSLRAHQDIQVTLLNAKTKADQKRLFKRAGQIGLTEDFIINRFLSKEQCEALIGIVGEPVLYQSLMELYHQTFGNQGRDFIQNQIDFLSSLKNTKI